MFFSIPSPKVLRTEGFGGRVPKKNIYCKGKFSNIDAEIVTYVYIAIKGN